MPKEIQVNPVVPALFESKLTSRILRGVAASAVGFAVLLTTALPVQADELDDRRSELTSRIAEQTNAVSHASGALTSATAALDAAWNELGAAEAALEAAEAARLEAQTLDAQRAEELAAAEYALKQAEADVAAAQAAFDWVEARTNEEIVVITQQSGPLLNLALLVTDVTAAELNQRAQLSTTLFDSSALELDELMERQFALDAAKVKVDEARIVAVTAREAAAKQLEDSLAKEASADALRDDVALKVEAHNAAADEATRQLNLEQSRQADLEAESADVDKRIAARVAAQKAAEEAAAKKAAEEAAAQRAAEEAAAARRSEDAAAQKAADTRAAANSAQQGSTASKPQAPAPRPQAPAPPAKPQAPSQAAASSSSAFLRPVSGQISSSYGMRLHPVLGYRKLHDGTDFAAGCGTPLKAAAAGTVSERYFNAGYGNRLMIDHGQVDGKYVTTGYNHATRYTVGVGQKVAKGEVVGYVGTTGYSTGCHLHLMVWENGSMVDPMARWFR